MFELNGTTSVPKSVPRSVLDKVLTQMFSFNLFPIKVAKSTSKTQNFEFFYLIISKFKVDQENCSLGFSSRPF